MSAADIRIRSFRAAKPVVDPYAAHGAVVEVERRPDRTGGQTEHTLTIFLAGAECPFTCSFCDLWRYTIDGPTPVGALPTQIAAVLEKLDASAPSPDRLKLYNASNFFDRRAVPAADLPRIAELASSFSGVTVESHASTIGPPALAFARRLTGGGRLEVAVGLETIHPLAAAQLNKRLDLHVFDNGARWLADNGMDLRVFVLLGAPHVPTVESVEWTVRTVEHAAQRGASIVSIIPVRGGNGEMERLAALGHFTPPTLSQLEDALDRCLPITGTAVTADLWDIERLGGCGSCHDSRVERLRRLNVGGRPEPRIACAQCELSS
ncbi:MAG: radical SAM protein [Gemmatimonadota bacterium]|nr:radical SAM protein [Gemmatimonadota bacterium]